MWENTFPCCGSQFESRFMKSNQLIWLYFCTDVISRISIKGNSHQLAMSVRWRYEPLPACALLLLVLFLWFSSSLRGFRNPSQDIGRNTAHCSLLKAPDGWCQQDHGWGWSSRCVCHPIQGPAWLIWWARLLSPLSGPHWSTNRPAAAVCLVKEVAFPERERGVLWSRVHRHCTNGPRRHSFWAPLLRYFYEPFLILVSLMHLPGIKIRSPRSWVGTVVLPFLGFLIFYLTWK